MLNVEFEDHFKKCPSIYPSFLGVFSLDTCPRNIKNRTFFISNMSKKNEIGSHWISIVKSSPDLVEIFDSLGTKYDVLKPYLKFNKKPNIIFNDCPFQMATSTTCGLFAITFCVNRCLNFDLKYKELLAHVFSDDLNKNEQIVTEFVSEL